MSDLEECLGIRHGGCVIDCLRRRRIEPALVAPESAPYDGRFSVLVHFKLEFDLRVAGWLSAADLTDRCSRARSWFFWETLTGMYTPISGSADFANLLGIIHLTLVADTHPGPLQATWLEFSLTVFARSSSLTLGIMDGGRTVGE